MIIFGVLLRCVIFAKWIGAENNYQKADQKVIKDLNDSSGSQFASPKSVDQTTSALKCSRSA